MSTKVKINITLLFLMFASTFYFLHLIDVQERVIVQYSIQRSDRNNNKFNLDEFMGDSITSNQVLLTKQTITELYRYMLATDGLILISILVISKSINKEVTS